jgi:hypothetical protein
MCCFSRPIRHVSKTRIFARPLAEGRQLLVYSMSLEASGDLAMVLPVPVPPGSAEDAVRFVDMSSCPTFFDRVDALFPAEISRAPVQGFGVGPAPQAKRLVVHDVGDFEASFVPSIADFVRLDPRFRLPEDVWSALPGYADWGFCVFKLREAPERSTSEGVLGRVAGLFRGAPPPAPRKYHPMAFELPRRDPSRLFFPTVHVHDGKVHPRAEFDHTLYCQVAGDVEAVESAGDGAWQRSPQRVSAVAWMFADAAAWLDQDAHVHRLVVKGSRANEDIYVSG